MRFPATSRTGLLCALLTTGASLFSVAAGTPQVSAAAANPDSNPGYVRMCTEWQRATATQIASERAADHRDLISYYPTHLEDAQVAELARGALIQRKVAGFSSSDVVAVAYRSYQKYGPSAVPANGEGDIISVTSPLRGTVRYLLVLDPKGKVVRIRPIADNDEHLRLTYEFARAMAAYILFNDLMGADTVIPRRGCSLALRFQLGAAPEVLEEVEGNLAGPPAFDAAIGAAIRKAYAALPQSNDAHQDAQTLLTRETLQHLGADPSVSLVYRDQASILGTDSQYIVARLTNGSSRAYVLIDVDAGGTATFAVLPLCLVGDTRCAQYYLWP